MVTGGEGCRERIVREFRMSMCMLLLTYFKWITTNVLLYSTRNCLMSCGSLDGRGVLGRMDTCMCVTESLCCPPKTITTLLTGSTPL